MVTSAVWSLLLAEINDIHSLKLRQWNTNHLKMVLLSRIAIFHCYVSFQGGYVKPDIPRNLPTEKKSLPIPSSEGTPWWRGSCMGSIEVPFGQRTACQVWEWWTGRIQKNLLGNKHHSSGRTLIFHQPTFPWNKRISRTKTTIWGEVVWGRYNLTR